MKEIKFRGKCLKTGKWVYGGYFTTSEEEGPVTYIYDHYKGAVPVDPETVGEYTGLKDRNGVEIYNGDILQREGYKYEHVVKWWDESCGFNLAWVSDSIRAGFAITIIGNVCENPEMIGGK